ncbi:hypothetical protein CW304_32110, partial [Bacillus sp. UFRGS-B20]
RGHVLVKFTRARTGEILAPDNNPVSERWRTLLAGRNTKRTLARPSAAEHLALRVLCGNMKFLILAATAFLEIPRFERVGQLGRMASSRCGRCGALDAEFVGNAPASWPVSG